MLNGLPVKQNSKKNLGSYQQQYDGVFFVSFADSFE